MAIALSLRTVKRAFNEKEQNLKNNQIKIMKLKTTISMLAVAASAVAVHQAHANTIDATEDLSNNGLEVVSTVYLPDSTSAFPTDYEYTYSATGGQSDAFTVSGVNPAFIVGISSTGNWAPSATQTDAHISWISTFNSGSDTTLATYEFFSPYAPIQGVAFSQDSAQYGPTTAYVPGTPAVPDSGTTMTLLSGALLGLAGLRRKLGC